MVLKTVKDGCLDDILLKKVSILNYLMITVQDKEEKTVAM